MGGAGTRIHFFKREKGNASEAQSDVTNLAETIDPGEEKPVPCTQGRTSWGGGEVVIFLASAQRQQGNYYLLNAKGQFLFPPTPDVLRQKGEGGVL